VTNVHKNTVIFANEAYYLKSGRITREAYDEVRRLAVPRFVVLWEEGEPLPPPDVALVCRPCLGTGLTGGGGGPGSLNTGLAVEGGGWGGSKHRLRRSVGLYRTMKPHLRLTNTICMDEKDIDHV
jgi:hypothetical protein